MHRAYTYSVHVLKVQLTQAMVCLFSGCPSQVSSVSSEPCDWYVESHCSTWAGLIPGRAEAVKMTIMSLPNWVQRGWENPRSLKKKTSTIIFNSSILEKEIHLSEPATISPYAQPHQHQRSPALAELLSENHRSCDRHITPSLPRSGDKTRCHALIKNEGRWR